MAQTLKIISPEAYQFGGEYQLGTPIAQYKVGYSRLVVTTLILCGLAALFFIGLTIALTIEKSDLASLSIPLVLAVVTTLISVYYLLYSIIYRSWGVYIYADGFVSTRWSKVQVFRWDSIAEVIQQIVRTSSYGVSTGTRHRYIVKGLDGSKVSFKNDFTKIEELGNTLVEKSTNSMMPRLIAAYNAGNFVPFGPLHVSVQGIGKGQNILSWGDLGRINLSNGYLNIEKKSKFLNWASYRVAKFPNVLAFSNLVQYALSKQR